MKRILSVLLAVAMIASMFLFVSCEKEEKSIVVGYTIYKPMNYKDEDGKLVGFDTELAEKVFKNLGYDKVIFQEIKWENKYTDLNGKSIDCIWNGFTCNSKDDDGVERKDKVDFSYNYMENRQVVVVKADSAIASAEDLSAANIVAEQGSAGESYASEFDGAVVKGVEAQTDCLMEVKSGAADAAVLDALLSMSYVGTGDYKDLKVIETLSGGVEYYAIGFRKGSELTAKVNAELEKLAADGTIKALAEKYKVVDTVITDFSDQK